MVQVKSKNQNTVVLTNISGTVGPPPLWLTVVGYTPENLVGFSSCEPSLGEHYHSLCISN